MLLNNFIYAELKSLFEAELEAGNILNEAIVFLQDTGEIWTHGHYFATSLSQSEIENLIKTSETIEEFINNLIDSKAEVAISDSEPTNGEKIWIDTSKDSNIDVVEEAPQDGKQYVRQNGEWTTIDIVDLLSYGVEWDITVADPELTRIGNPLLHRSLPIQSAYRGCVANGNVINYYLDPNDWSKKADGTNSVLDGTDGSVRVHTPKFYGKGGEDGNKRWVRISTIQIDSSWVEIPELLVDAYRCTVDQTDAENLKAASVVNTTTQFRGGNNSTTYDQYLESDQFRTLLGKPRTNVTRANMRTYAKNAGSELLSYELYKWIFYWAWVIEYATFDSQATYNAELTSEGYHQGGLGAGVTSGNYNHWEYYNNANPVTPCGYLNEFGNGTGIKEMTCVMPTTSGGDPTQSYTFQVPRWRGFDNPFGDIWTNLDGIVIDTPTTGASDTGVLPTAYIITDPEKYTDDLEEAKTNAVRSLQQPHGEGYIKEWHIGVNADMIPKAVGGTSSTYMCDYYWVNYDDTPETLIVSGRLNSGSAAGLGYFHSNTPVGHVSPNVGFRTITRV